MVPKTLEKYMAVKGGAPVATRFRMRVLTTKLSKAFTSVRSSPIIGPEKVKPSGTGTGTGTGTGGTDSGGTDSGGTDSGGAGGGAPAPTCPVGGPNGDDDGDLLSNWQESIIKTDPCCSRHRRRRHLGLLRVLVGARPQPRQRGDEHPVPGRTALPEPAGRGDADTDFDGDVMTLREEFAMWADPRYGNEVTRPELQRRQAGRLWL